MHVPARTCTDLRAHMHLNRPAHIHVHTHSLGLGGCLQLQTASALDFSGSWFCLPASFSSSFPSPPAPSSLRTPSFTSALLEGSRAQLIVSGGLLPGCRQEVGAERPLGARPQVRAAGDGAQGRGGGGFSPAGPSACSLRAHVTLVLQPGPPWPGSTDTERRREGRAGRKGKGERWCGGVSGACWGPASSGGSGASPCRFQPRLLGDARSPPGRGSPRPRPVSLCLRSSAGELRGVHDGDLTADGGLPLRPPDHDLREDEDGRGGECRCDPVRPLWGPAGWEDTGVVVVRVTGKPPGRDCLSRVPRVRS